MANVRIRWRGVMRVVAIVAVALIALHLLPGLLRAPEPPPLTADVGLPRAKTLTGASRRKARPAATVPPHRATKPSTRLRRGQRTRSRPVPDAPASTAVIGSRHRPRHGGGSPATYPAPTAEATPPAESSPSQVPEYVPPPAPPEPGVEPPPEPTPPSSPAPGDGSEEFAPH
jgi:hypothetical protein